MLRGIAGATTTTTLHTHAVHTNSSSNTLLPSGHKGVQHCVCTHTPRGCFGGVQKKPPPAQHRGSAATSALTRPLPLPLPTSITSWHDKVYLGRTKTRQRHASRERATALCVYRQKGGGVAACSVFNDERIAPLSVHVPLKKVAGGGRRWPTPKHWSKREREGRGANELGPLPGIG